MSDDKLFLEMKGQSDYIFTQYHILSLTVSQFLSHDYIQRAENYSIGRVMDDKKRSLEDMELTLKNLSKL